jgi:predicted DNA-binding transcriptional regulator YafY
LSTNKNATLRYQVLDRCFRNPGRTYFWEDLLNECNLALVELDYESKGIQRRQLFEDIRFMESPQGWNIPLERFRFGKKVYYRYSDLNFSINSQPLNELELSQIKSALVLFSKFRGLPQFTWIKEIINRLEGLLHITPEASHFIGYDSNEYLSGIEHLGSVFNAILYKRVLKISYKGFKASTSKLFRSHPYFLKQYNNRWFVFGHNPATGELQNLALDRIQSISETSDKFVENETYDFSTYFEDIIGVSLPYGRSPVDVQLKFEPGQAPYILTKPIHGSQRKISNNDTGLVISINVIPNFELEQLILSYGEHVEVLKPPSIRDQIRNRLSLAVSKYSG